MVQSSGRFKTAHTGCCLSAKAYGAVRRFETTLYGALYRGQSKKRYLHALHRVSFMYNPEAKRRGHLLNSNDIVLRKDKDMNTDWSAWWQERGKVTEEIIMRLSGSRETFSYLAGNLLKLLHIPGFHLPPGYGEPVIFPPRHDVHMKMGNHLVGCRAIELKHSYTLGP